MNYWPPAVLFARFSPDLIEFPLCNGAEMIKIFFNSHKVRLSNQSSACEFRGGLDTVLKFKNNKVITFEWREKVFFCNRERRILICGVWSWAHQKANWRPRALILLFFHPPRSSFNDDVDDDQRKNFFRSLFWTLFPQLKPMTRWKRRCKMSAKL